MAPATILYPVPELALLSAGVRRCMPAAVVVVTQLDTQLLRFGCHRSFSVCVSVLPGTGRTGGPVASARRQAGRGLDSAFGVRHRH